MTPLSELLEATCAPSTTATCGSKELQHVRRLLTDSFLQRQEARRKDRSMAEKLLQNVSRLGGVVALAAAT